ncbi:hypothetical protein PVK06_027923 [Gossypium arboreum]|uniref:Reverse transcriptase n=1 Tax=Gossypium arboreum TaxID=29729 RepID=A0ABR0P1N9_GOSAR|nr:hypothetical protein PVK06_027923 [Gossypium arboreum]
MERIRYTCGYANDIEVELEGLSSLMRLATRERLLKGVKASRSEPTCSGQRVNFNKSTVFFSKNTSDDDGRVVVNILGVRSSNNLERYLGLPNIVGRKKRESFQNLTSISRWEGVLSPNFGGGRDKAKGEYTGNLPSLTWKSVWAAKGILQSGLCWRTGRGTEIFIWDDRWIPSAVLGKKTTPTSFGTVLQHQSELMRDFYAINLGVSLGFPLVTLMGDSRTVMRKC